jgi:ribosomal protein S18 acetylase RimI-like enzyme
MPSGTSPSETRRGEPRLPCTDQSSVDEAASMMARAFFDYPMWQWIMPDEEHRRRALPISARASVLWGQLLGETFAVGAPMRGLAVWARPGMADEDVDPDGSRTDWDNVVAAVGPEGMRRFETMIEVQKPLREKYIPEGGWYLAWLGVEPAEQKSGIGSALLRDMLDRLDEDGAATYLETEKAANVPYYLKHGYEVVHQGVLPDDGPEYFCFLRQPQQGTRDA